MTRRGFALALFVAGLLGAAPGSAATGTSIVGDWSYSGMTVRVSASGSAYVGTLVSSLSWQPSLGSGPCSVPAGTVVWKIGAEKANGYPGTALTGGSLCSSAKQAPALWQLDQVHDELVFCSQSSDGVLVGAIGGPAKVGCTNLDREAGTGGAKSGATTTTTKTSTGKSGAGSAAKKGSASANIVGDWLETDVGIITVAPSPGGWTGSVTSTSQGTRCTFNHGEAIWHIAKNSAGNYVGTLVTWKASKCTRQTITKAVWTVSHTSMMVTTLPGGAPYSQIVDRAS